MSHVCHDTCAHTVSVGYVHTLTVPGGPCRADCPHPDHRDKTQDHVVGCLGKHGGDCAVSGLASNEPDMSWYCSKCKASHYGTCPDDAVWTP